MKKLLGYAMLFSALLLTSCKASKEYQSQANAANTKLEACQSEMTGMQVKLNDANNDIKDMEVAKKALEEEVAMTKYRLDEVTQEMQENSDDYGVWFRVQIGAYKERQIDENLVNSDDLALEASEDSQKVSLGRFRSYEDAKSLKTQLQGMGLKDAWIVTYKDGMRVPIDSVMPSAGN